MPRLLATGVIAVALVLAPPALAAVPPKMADSTKGAKRCGKNVRNRHGGHFDVYVTKGKQRISCRRARSIVKRHVNVHGWRYFDWTKGGNGPWSDVWQRRDNRAVVAAIIRCVDGLDDDDDLPPCRELYGP